MRPAITPHKSLRRLVFHPFSLVSGIAVASLVDFLLIWKGTEVLEWHSRIVRALLELAAVP
ncbi:MAG: hypothetical protein HY648_08280 [Acidobacteria bacterium]|nr:hypothetical protein [Acidobacteriota bacterium]